MEKLAQEFIVLEPTNENNFVVEEVDEDTSEDNSEVIRLEESSDEPNEFVEVVDSNQPIEIEIVLSELPGAPDNTPDPVIEVKEEDSDKKDKNDLSEKKKDKWDWSSSGLSNFVNWVKEKLQNVPAHSGLDEAGLERAISYMDKINSEISKAMRSDIDGELDSQTIEHLRKQINDGLDRLEKRLEKVVDFKKKKKKAYQELGFIKSAQKITGVKGVFVTVDLLTSRIARVCINGAVSAGHDIEKIFAEQVKKYDLNKREQAQVIQLLEDMGYPVREDRAYLPSEESTGNGDWMTNYTGA